MKTLILYATKYGAAREIAERIANRISGSTVYDLKSNTIPPIDQYDCVIIGSSLYIGKIRKEAKAFLLRYADALLDKNIGLFLSGLEPEHAEAYFTNNIPEKLLRSAKTATFLGGSYSPEKGSALDKLLLKAAKKPSGNMNTISDEKITLFVEALTA